MRRMKTEWELLASGEVAEADGNFEIVLDKTINLYDPGDYIIFIENQNGYMLNVSLSMPYNKRELLLPSDGYDITVAFPHIDEVGNIGVYFRDKMTNKLGAFGDSLSEYLYSSVFIYKR